MGDGLSIYYKDYDSVVHYISNKLMTNFVSQIEAQVQLIL